MNTPDFSEDNGLVEPSHLYELLHQNTRNLKVIDATYRTGEDGLPADLAFIKSRIDNAVRFDIDDIADLSAPLAHTAPSPDFFGEKVSQLGISNEDRIVVYDQTGIFMAACRAWWLFKLFGHEKVWVLNGGLPAWKAEGFPLNNAPAITPEAATFEVTAHKANMLYSLQDIKENIESAAAKLIDARAEKRFGNKSCDSGCRTDTGHIPGSLNLPFMNIIDPHTKKMITSDRVEDFFKTVGVTPSEKAVFTCGSGVTACVLALSAYNAGQKNPAVYDGSWTEWSM